MTVCVSFCSSASKKNLFQRLTASAAPRLAKRKNRMAAVRSHACARVFPRQNPSERRRNRRDRLQGVLSSDTLSTVVRASAGARGPSDDRAEKLSDTGGQSHRQRAPECHSSRRAQDVGTARSGANRAQKS